MMMKILIADDHSQVMEGICESLKKLFPEGEIVSCVHPRNVLKEQQKSRFDVFILDLEYRNAQDMSGFDLIDKVRKRDPNARIIVNTMHDEIWTIGRLMEMGLNGIILKSSALCHITEAVQKVLRGGRYVCPEFQKFVSEKADEIIPFKESPLVLTQKEKIVLSHIMQGFTIAEIAATMHVTPDAIDYHKKNLFKKFQAKNMAHLAALAATQGFIG